LSHHRGRLFTAARDKAKLFAAVCCRLCRLVTQIHYSLQRKPNTQHVHFFCVAIILRVLVLGRIGPALIRQLGPHIENTVYRQLIGAQQVFGQIEQRRLDQQRVHIGPDQIAPRAAHIRWTTRRRPQMCHSMRKV